MEKKTIRAPYQLKEQIVEYHNLLGYQLEEEKNLPFSGLKLVFSREKSDEKVVKVEMEYRLYPFLNFIPVIIGCLIILVLATLFFVFSMTNTEARLTYFFSFMIPAFCILPFMAVYTYFRFSFDAKNIRVLTSLNDIKKSLEG